MSPLETLIAAAEEYLAAMDDEAVHDDGNDGHRAALDRAIAAEKRLQGAVNVAKFAITPEMIEAGTAEMARYDEALEFPESAVARIFRAMSAAKTRLEAT